MRDDIGFTPNPVLRCPCGWRMPQIAVGARTQGQADLAEALDVAMECPDCKRVHVSRMVLGPLKGPRN